MDHRLLRSFLGALAVTAGCATDSLDVDTGRECVGIETAAPSLAGTLTATGDALTATVTNTDSAPARVEVTLHARDGHLATQQALPAFELAAGATQDVRVALAHEPTLPTLLKTELVRRSPTGEVLDRSFLHTMAGPELSVAARQLGLPLVETIEGERAELGGIVLGGPGVQTTAALDLAAGLSYNMCFRVPVTITDAGFGEDYGADPTSPWIARGNRVVIMQAGQVLFNNWLDNLGCTGPFEALGTTNFTITGYSRARINGNEIVVRDSAGMQSSWIIWDADPGSNKNPVYEFPEVPAVSTLLAVSAYTLEKFHSGMTGRLIPVENRCQPGGGCCNCSSNNSLWVTSPTRKFLIAHEMGHRLLALYIGGYNNDTSFDLDRNDVLGCDLASTVSHGMWSMELESGAAMEGWAHFIAVATFNDRAGTNPGASMRYWSASGTTVDVEQGPIGGASNYFDNVCPGVSVPPSMRLGVELDWMRHWWDFYTNATASDPGVRPSVKTMMEDLEAANGWAASTAWTRISAGIEANSGAAQRDRWEQLGAWNGID
jgi:hypothetical protein